MKVEKPIDYNLAHKTPYKEWKQEWKDYKNWMRRIKMNPKIADMSDEEYREYRSKASEVSRKAWKDKYESMNESEKSEVNKKKGSFWNNASDEEKEKMRGHLSDISKLFWDSMSEDEQKQFGQYRWNLKSDEEKDEIITRFNHAGVERMKNLSKEEIDAQIKVMNEARAKKFENDKEFRETQIELLKKHCKEYFDSLSKKEFEDHYKSMVGKSRELFMQQWENDKEFRNSQIELLRSISKLGGEAVKYKWENDKEFRKHTIEILNNARYEFWKNLNNSERSKILSRNKLNIKFEKLFNESILSNDFYFIPEYIISEDNSPINLNKKWDYGIFTKNNSELVLLLDIDGSFYHGDSNDYTAIHSNEDIDERRGYFVPDNVKIHIISEDNLLNGFKELITKLMINYDEYISTLFNEYHSIEFPYPHYSNKELIDSILQLLKLNPDNKYINLSSRNREGDRVITHFHHSIYHARCGNLPSPYEAWNDDKLLKKCIENRTLYRSTIDSNKILQGFNVSKIAPKVSVFSAGRAKMLISKYLNECDEIFDPFSGFSGRMLGTMSLGKLYIGQDISQLHIKESNDIIRFIKLSSNYYTNITYPILKHKNILQSNGEYECLFTCPPYSDKEKWKNVKPDKRTCDDWIDECLSRFKCRKYLFVVDYTEKYKEFIVDKIVNKSHFGSNSEYVILIQR